MKEKMICRGDLFYYDFGDNSGSVQSGERPVLVVQADDYNQNAPTIIVAAVTSVIKKRYLPSHIILGEEFGLKKIEKMLAPFNLGDMPEIPAAVTVNRANQILNSF